MNKTSKKLVSVLLSLVLLLSFSPLCFAQQNEGASGYAEYEETAYEEGLTNATTDQIASLIFDLADMAMANEEVAPVDIAPELSLELNSVDGIIAQVYDIITNDKLGGSFNDMNAAALNGLVRANGDLKLLYGIVQFVADNAAIAGSILTQGFDFGGLADLYPDEIALIEDFNLNELIREAMGIDGEEGSPADMDEFVVNFFSDSVGEMFKEADMLCDFKIDTDSIYAFADNILEALLGATDAISGEMLDFVQYIRIMGITLLYTAQQSEITEETEGYADIKAMFFAQYGEDFPCAAIKTTETTEGVESVVFYVPCIFTSYETIYDEYGNFVEDIATNTYGYYKMTALGTLSTTILDYSFNPERNAELSAIYTGPGKELWTYEGTTYYVDINPDDEYYFFPSIGTCFTVRECNDYDNSLLAQVKEGTPTASYTDLSAYASVEGSSEISSLRGFEAESPDISDIRDFYYSVYHTNVTDSQYDIYNYNGTEYIVASAEYYYECRNSENVLVHTFTRRGETLYKYTELPSLLNDIDFTFNIDFDNFGILDYQYAAENNGILSNINHILYTALDVLLTDEAFAALAITDGSNENLSGNLEKILASYWDSILEILSYVGADELNVVKYDEESGLDGYLVSWMKYVFNEEGSPMYLGEDVTTFAQFATLGIRLLFQGTLNEDDFTRFEAEYNSKIFDAEGQLLQGESNEYWLDVILNWCVDVGVYMLDKNVEAFDLSPEQVAEYKAQGWEWFDFFDEVVDWALNIVEGVFVVSDDFACERGVTDGNGPWYKLSKILSDAVSPLAVFNCGKLYNGTDYVPFDLGKLIYDDILCGAVNLDIGQILSFLETNKDTSNIFYYEPFLGAALKTVQKTVNSILPGTIEDGHITNISTVLENETLADVAANALAALNTRKTYLVPAVLEILAKCGLFDSVMSRGSCGDNLTYVLDGRTGELVIEGYGDMYEFEYSSQYWDTSYVKTVSLPDGITSISSYAFSESYIKEIAIPASVTKIGDYAFTYCTKLVRIEVEETNENYETDESGLLYNADKTSLLAVPRQGVEGDIVIPASCTDICDPSINASPNVTSITYLNMDCSIPSYYMSREGNVCTIYCHEGSSAQTAYSYMDSYSFNVVTQCFPGEWIVDTEATCISAGSRHSTCTICGNTIEEAIPTGGHVPGEWIVDTEATCTEDGSKSSTCTVCGEATTEIIPATGHTLGDWIVDTAATCTVAGSQHKACTVCLETIETEAIPATGHTLGDWIVDTAATCTVAGTKHKACTVCLETVETEAIPATGHTLGDWIVDTAATCTVAGTKHKACTVCGDTVETGTIPVIAHTPGEWIVDTAATCTAAGTQHKACTVCGTTVETGTIPATGHTPGEWIVDTDATCTAAGTQHKACTVCGTTVETGTIPATGHSDDNSDGVCDNCDEELSNEEPEELSFFEKISAFFQKIIDWFKNLFK